MKAAPFLFCRVVVAIVLMAGFYVLAMGMTALLLWIPYAELTYVGEIHLRLALLCLVGAVVIFWSIIPRIDRFRAPGPELKPEEHPELFSNLVEVARIAGQRMPREVYLVADVNAWVSERGGFMGVGSRRVMGLGLPLLATVTRGQLRAILMHEFGHFHGGDTKLAPWIYKTRAAITRTFRGLAAQKSIMVYPFLWYSKGFLRVTEAISRQQELAADWLAAQAAGARNLSEGLVSVHRSAPAFEAYMHEEFVPVVEAGFYCPLVEGFLNFLHAPSTEKKVCEQLKRQLAGSERDPYDSHPPLGDRLKRLESLPEFSGPRQMVRPST